MNLRLAAQPNENQVHAQIWVTTRNGESLQHADVGFRFTPGAFSSAQFVPAGTNNNHLQVNLMGMMWVDFEQGARPSVVSQNISNGEVNIGFESAGATQTPPWDTRGQNDDHATHYYLGTFVLTRNAVSTSNVWITNATSATAVSVRQSAARSANYNSTTTGNIVTVGPPINTLGETPPPLPQPIAQPQNFTATRTATNQVTLSWTAVTGATGYRLYRVSGTPPVATLIQELTGNANTSRVFDMPVPGEYSFRVIAVAENPELNSSPANTSINAPARQLPTPTLSLNGNQISWTMPNQDPALSATPLFRIYTGTASNSVTDVGGFHTSPYNNLPTTTGVHYARVRAMPPNSWYLQSAQSEHVRLVNREKLPTPTFSISGGNLNYTFDARAERFEYQIGATSWQTATAGMSLTSILTTPGTHYVRMRAFGGDVWTTSDESAALQVTVLAAPGTVGVSDNASDNILTWETVTGATGYEVQINETPRTVVNGESSITSFLQPNNNTIRVRALGNGGTLFASPWATITYNYVVPAVTSVTATPNTITVFQTQTVSLSSLNASVTVNSIGGADDGYELIMHNNGGIVALANNSVITSNLEFTGTGTVTIRARSTFNTAQFATITITVNPTITFSPSSTINVTNTNLNQPITVGGLTTSPISLNDFVQNIPPNLQGFVFADEIPANLRGFVSVSHVTNPGTITVTATRPDAHTANINGDFDIVVSRDGITATLRINVNLTMMPPTLELALSTADAVGDTVTMSGTARDNATVTGLPTGIGFTQLGNVISFTDNRLPGSGAITTSHNISITRDGATTDITVTFSLVNAVQHTISLDPDSVTINDTNPTRVVAVTSSATTAIEFTRNDLPDAITLTQNGNNVNIGVGTRAPGSPAINGIFTVQVHRGGVGVSATANLYITVDLPLVPHTFTLSPATVNINNGNFPQNGNFTQTVNLGGSAPGSITLNEDDIDELRAGLSVVLSGNTIIVTKTWVSWGGTSNVSGTYLVRVTRDGIEQTLTIVIALTELPPAIAISTPGIAFTDTTPPIQVTVTGTATDDIEVVNLPEWLTVSINQQAGIITFTAHRPPANQDEIDFDGSVQIKRGEETVNLGVTAFLTKLDPTFTLNPTTVTINNANLTRTITLTNSTATGTIEVIGLPEGVSYSIAGNVITLTGTPSDQPGDNITFDGPITVRQQGVERTFTLNVNLTSTFVAPTLTLTPATVNINEGNLTQTVNLTGTATGSITFNQDDINALPAGLSVTPSDSIITVAKNWDGKSNVSGTYQVRVTRDGIEQTLTIVIALTERIAITTSQITLTDTSLTAQVTVTGSATSPDIEVIGLPAWITASINQQTGVITFTATRAQANQAERNFDNYVTIQRGTTISVDLRVTANLTKYAPTFTLDPTTITINNANLTRTITLTYNTAEGEIEVIGLPTGVAVHSIVGNVITLRGTPSNEPGVNITFNGPITVRQQGVVQTFTLNVNLTSTWDAPTVTFDPVSVSITDLNLSQPVEVTGTAIGNINVSYTIPIELQGFVSVSLAAGTPWVTITGTRPEDDIPPVIGNFTISVTRQGITQSFDVSVNLTTTWIWTPPISVSLSPATIAINNNNLIATVTIGGTATGPITVGIMPEGITYEILDNVITFTGTRPTTDVEGTVGAFNVSITREGASQNLTINANITTTWRNLTVTLVNGNTQTVHQHGTTAAYILFNLAPHAPTLAGHIFEGWAYMVGGSVVYAHDATIQVTNNINLYAIFVVLGAPPPDGLTRLPTPINIRRISDEPVLVWNVVPNASGYGVFVNGIRMAALDRYTVVFDFGVFNLKPGSYFITIVAIGDNITWYDSHQSMGFVFNVEAPPAEPPAPPTPPTSNIFNEQLLIIGIIAGVIALALIVFAFIRKRKKDTSREEAIEAISKATKALLEARVKVDAVKD